MGRRCYSYLSQVYGPVPSADRSDTASKVPGILEIGIYPSGKESFPSTVR
jgi:hypothetical protein